MLAVIPFNRRLAIGKSEIAVRTEMPKDTPIAFSIQVIDFYDPVLVAHGKKEIAIVRRVDKRVAMRPIS